jgi:hypothetical protein
MADDAPPFNHNGARQAREELARHPGIVMP